MKKLFTRRNANVLSAIEKRPAQRRQVFTMKCRLAESLAKEIGPYFHLPQKTIEGHISKALTENPLEKSPTGPFFKNFPRHRGFSLLIRINDMGISQATDGKGFSGR